MLQLARGFRRFQDGHLGACLLVHQQLFWVVGLLCLNVFTQLKYLFEFGLVGLIEMRGKGTFLPTMKLSVRTFQALWMEETRNITDDMHEEFYRFVANAYDKPRYQLHYRADAPLNIRALFYVPDYKPSEYALWALGTPAGSRVCWQSESDRQTDTIDR